MSTEDPPINKSVRSVWWAPQTPSLLTINEVGRKNGGAAPLLTQYPLYADTGVSCNAHEFTALLKIIAAHEDFFAGNSSDLLDESQSIKVLSKKYRDAIRDCRNDWDEELGHDQLDVNLELLTFVYCIMHLSDIYLLSPPENLDKPGSVTADTVRFLRLHYGLGAKPEDLAIMRESEYPEQYDGYWRYVRSLIYCGCLEEAWNMLSVHSLFRMASAFDPDADPGFAAKAHEIRYGFLQLKELLFFAPLPGGRTDVFDEEENTIEIDESIAETTTMEGIDLAPTDYKFWESENAYGDYPISFSPETARRKHRRWREHVESVRASSTLAHQIPEIDSILAVLTGNFANAPTFASWAEQFCAELLYKTPDLRPINCSNRARKIMKDFGRVDDAIVSIMQQEAGKAIEQIYQFGGGSGAALPSTLVRTAYETCVPFDCL